MPAPGIDTLQAGLWVPPGAPFVGQGSVSLTVANRGYGVRFACPRSMTVTKLGFFVVTAATADDPCDVGIYAPGAPCTLLGSSGPVSGLLNSVGAKQANFAAGIPLVQGQIYYASFSVGALGGTGAALQMTTTANSVVWQIFGFSPTTGLEQGFNNVAFPLPASLALANGITNCPIMALIQ